jgi:hypothetical protein
MSYPGITTITVTANRAYTWGIWERFAGRAIEAYPGEVQCVVVNGGWQEVPVCPGTIITDYIKRLALEDEEPAANFISNIKLGLAAAKHNIVAFLEDDDAYDASYLMTTAKFLNASSYDMVGLSHNFYYNVPLKAFYKNDNTAHSSLCTTMLRGHGVDAARRIIASLDTPYLDMELWQRTPKLKKHISPNDGLVTQIKGLNDVYLSSGHSRDNLEFGNRKYVKDPYGKVLDDRLNKRDADYVRVVWSRVRERMEMRNGFWSYDDSNNSEKH